MKKKPLIEVGVSCSDGTDIELSVESSTTYTVLLEKVTYLLGIFDTKYFALQKSDVWCDSKQRVRNGDKLKLLARYLPEDASELIQSVTIGLVFAQVRNSILSGSLACPADTALLLASYDLAQQAAENGEFIKECPSDGSVLPERLRDLAGWRDKLMRLTRRHTMLCREEARLGYLRVAQELPGYGVTMFSVSNKKNTPLQLGIDALGLALYDGHQVPPRVTFGWAEIKWIAWKRGRVLVRPDEGDTLEFRAEGGRDLLTLCAGHHELFRHRRQKEDPLRIHVTALAHARRDRSRVMRQRLIRTTEDLIGWRSKAEQTSDAASKAEAAAALFAEKANIMEEEARLIGGRAGALENELHALRQSRAALTARLSDTERLAKCLAAQEDVSSLSAQIDRNRQETMEGSRLVQMELTKLRSELESLQRGSESPPEEFHSRLDSWSKAQRGRVKSRVNLFEEL